MPIPLPGFLNCVTTGMKKRSTALPTSVMHSSYIPMSTWAIHHDWSSHLSLTGTAASGHPHP